MALMMMMQATILFARIVPTPQGMGGGDGDADERGMHSDLSPARDPCDPDRDPS